MSKETLISTTGQKKKNIIQEAAIIAVENNNRCCGAQITNPTKYANALKTIAFESSMQCKQEELYNFLTFNAHEGKRDLYVDLDGIIFDFRTYALAYANTLGLGEFKTIRDVNKSKQRRLIMKTMFSERDVFLELEVIEEAKAVIRQLKLLDELGVNVMFLTAAGLLDLDTAHRHKYQSLKKACEEQGYLTCEMTTVDDDKSFYATDSSCLIDDWDKNTKAFTEAGSLGILMDTEHLGNGVLNTLTETLRRAAGELALRKLEQEDIGHVQGTTSTP